jgi:hypothetical protein
MPWPNLKVLVARCDGGLATRTAEFYKHGDAGACF